MYHPRAMAGTVTAQGSTLFPCSGPYPCTSWPAVVYYQKWNGKFFKNNTNNKMLLIVSVVAQNCRLLTQIIWSLCKKKILLSPWYSISNYKIKPWKMENIQPPKKLCRKSGTNIAKEKKEVMTPQTSVHVIQGYKRHTRENHHSSKPHAQMLRRDNMTFFSVTMPFTHHHFTDGYKMLSIITNQIQLISY